MMQYSLPVLALSLFSIGVLSERLIGYVAVLSRIFRLSEMAAGFILLSVTTSLPELAVSTLAAIAGEGGLSTGNVLGSNIANLTIIIGLSVLISGRQVIIEGESQKELVKFLFLSSIIPLFIVQRGSLGPILGIVLLTLFIYFSVTLSRRVGTTEAVKVSRKGDAAVVVLKFAASAALIVVFSRLVVDSSMDIAALLGVPPSIIGATVVALGTSLPELTTTVQALRKKLFGMALGSLFGSCVTNITLILGVASLISFSEVDVLAVQSIMFYVLLSSLSIWYLVDGSGHISRRSAFLLCIIYFVFVLQQIGISVFIF